MWSFFRKIASRFSGGGNNKNEHTSLLPNDVDKLRREFSAEEELEGPGGPITAREAFELAEEILVGFDPDAGLRRIESKGALNQAGQADGWVFDFLLPNRWGHAKMTFNTLAGDGMLRLRLTPFAAEGSALDNMLSEGQDGFVEQQWKVELERQPTLPHSFKDSADVIAYWEGQGNQIPYQKPILLRALTPPLGKARWELSESPDQKKSLYKLPIE